MKSGFYESYTSHSSSMDVMLCLRCPAWQAVVMEVSWPQDRLEHVPVSDCGTFRPATVSLSFRHTLTPSPTSGKLYMYVYIPHVRNFEVRYVYVAFSTKKEDNGKNLTHQTFGTLPYHCSLSLSLSQSVSSRQCAVWCRERQTREESRGTLEHCSSCSPGHTPSHTHSWRGLCSHSGSH